MLFRFLTIKKERLPSAYFLITLHIINIDYLKQKMVIIFFGKQCKSMIFILLQLALKALSSSENHAIINHIKLTN